MMKKLLAILAITLLVVAVNQGQAKADPFAIKADHPNILETLKPDKAQPKQKPAKKYKVVSGDTLTKIAVQQKVSVQRLYDKNKQVKNPDVLKVGWTITIPRTNEKLHKRSLSRSSVVSSSEPKTPVQGSTSGNLYAFGNCTHYAKERRPDLPNNLGNADAWLYNAQAQGLPTSSKPKVGAVAVAGGYMHVAIVEKVQGNRVFISEKNYNGFNVVSSRWSDASEWQGYIL